MTVWELPHQHLAQRVEIHDRLESTNTLALERSRDPGSAGLALLAHQQTAGRGQHGRHWLAPAGSSVLVSVILFPPPTLARPALLTAWAAVSVCEVIRKATGLEVRIKWPNDILIPEANSATTCKKVCGILIEQRRGPDLGDAPATVVGIGLNVRQPASHFAEAQLPFAGSLFSMSGQTLDSDSVARELLAKMDDLYGRLLRGDLGGLEEIWMKRLDLLHRRVRMELGDAVHEGKLIALNFAGLELELASGEILRTAPEAVRHLEGQG